MARESLFGERIVWQGRSRVVTVPFLQKATAVVAGIVSAVMICYAVVVAKSLAVPVGGMILFAAWCATLGLAAWRVPIWWRSQTEYLVTERHVIWRRGRIRRSIEIGQISYALVRWNRRHAQVGDLVVVRAVPTGALRRTLTLTLHDVDAPDRLWAIIRGVEPSAPFGSHERPLAQRLDPGERVLWSASPLGSAWTSRRAANAVAGAVLAAAFVRTLARVVPPISRVLRLLTPTLGAVLVVAAALGMLLFLSVAVAVAYAAFVRPARLARATRYFVTDARVLIRRGNEELLLDRSRIAYVIDAPSRKRHDVFLVLDGPQARALAPSGAFGGDHHDDALRPVFSGIADADTVGELLRAGVRDLAKKAA